MPKKGRIGDRYRKIKISKEKIRQRNKKEYAKIIVLAVFLLVITIGGSYALFQTTIKGNKQTEVVAGTLKVEYEDKNTISLNNASPLTDVEGLNQEPYTFTVRNIGTLNGKYTIYLEEKEGNTLDKSNIKYSIKEGEGDWSSPVLLSSGLVLKENRILEKEQEETYQIKMWLKEDATNEVQGQTYKAKVVVNVVQTNTENIVTTNPVIKLNGESIVKINQNEEYVDAGVSSVSSREEINIDKVKVRYEYNNGTTSESVERIDTSKVGIYYIYYEVEDSKGIKGVSTRVVNVVKKGTNTPTIVLKGEEEISLDYKEKYIEAGYEARDVEDGELTDKVVVEGVVNSEVAGTYIIKYIVIDSEGATASVVRKVIVNGKSQSLTAIVNKEEAENISTTVTIEAETDSEKAYYAVTTTDKKPGDSEYKELVNKRVSLNIVKNGRYYIFIKDSKGNITKKEIEVTNIDETKPSCSFEEGGYVEKGKTKEIGLICTDPADIATTEIEKERIEVSDSEVGAVESITPGEKIDKGYKYRLTVRGKNSGNFTLKLKANSVLDKVGNKNEEVESTTAKVVSMNVNTPEIELDLTGTTEKQIEISGTNIGKLSYESNNKETAIVTEEGIIRAVSPGVATITVTEANSGITTQIKVTVVKTLTAYFTKNGVGVKNISKTVGSCVIEDSLVGCNIELPLIEVEEKYDEDGWYKETERVGKSGNEYTLSDENTTNGKITLTAKAKLKEYTVTYDYATNGGTASSKASDKVAIGSSIDLTPSATKAGYTFVGWNTDKSAKQGLNSLEMGNESITLYAVYSKKIDATFYYYDGTKQATTTTSCTIYNKEASCNYTLPTVVRSSVGPESSTYKGVSNQVSSTTEAELNSKSASYYAYYLGYWKAKFNNQNSSISTIGSTSSSCESYKTTDGKTYSSGSCQVTLPSITITSNDYIIGGWNKNKNATSGIAALEKTTIGNSTVNDTEDSLTTNFYTIIGKKAVTRVATFNKNGAVSQTDSNNQASTLTTVTRSCTIAAVSNIASQTQATTCNVTTPTIVASSNTPTVLGYNTSSSATLATVNQNTAISLSSNPTYYAITKKEATTFTANWNANGATLSTTSQSSCNIAATYNGVAQGTSCTVVSPTIIAPKETPTVLGYNTSANSNSNNSNYDVTSKLLTLNSLNTGSTWYAQTKKDAVSYTISSYEKGSNISSIGTKTDSNSKCTINAVYNGSVQATSCTVTTPTITANTGYTSVGWNLTKGATTGSSVITLNSSNTGKVWYANATANSYTINYYDGTTLKGSSSAKVDTYPTLTKASSLSLSKTGYTFKGWATTNGGAVVYTDEQKLTSNLATAAGATVNLYAVWKDETSPVCSFSGTTATTTQNTTTITLSCTDTGSGIVQKTLSITDFITTANGSVVSVSAPVKITNGYSYTVTLKGLSVGTFTVSLKAGIISDIVGNSNVLTSSGNVSVNGRTYTVTFSKGSNVSAISSTSSSCTTAGSSLTCIVATYPTITTTTGYSATTWYDSTAKKDTGIASGGSGSSYAISQNTIMTAQAKANTYKIYFSANGGTNAPSQLTRTYGQDVTFPNTVPTKTGYTFSGWLYYGTGDSSSTATSTATNGTYGAGSVSSSSCTDCIPWANSDTTYVATWKANTYTIVYNANGGSGTMPSQTVNYDANTTISANTYTKTGYQFVGWTTKSDGSDDGYNWTGWTGTWKYVNGQYGISSNKLVLYARWKANTYTVKYDYNYLENNIFDTAYNTEIYNGCCSSGSLTSTGSSFDSLGKIHSVTSTNQGWYFGTRTVLTPGKTYTWQLEAKSSTATNALIGSEQSGNVNYAIGTEWKRITNTFTATNGSYTAFIFYNWFGSSSRTLQIRNAQLHEGNLNTKSYTLTYGTTLSTSYVEPTRAGYTFSGWYTDPIGGEKITATTAVEAENKTYYAHWTTNSYYYDVNPDSGIQSFDIKGAVGTPLTGQTDYWIKNYTGQEVTITNVKAKTGYTYTGYTLSGSLSEISGSTNTTIKTKLGAGSGSIALNSKINSYTVTYDYETNGGSSATKTSATVNYGSSIDLTPSATKAGYTFVGWNTNKTATTGLSSLTIGTSNVTLYAIYKKDVTITFNKNGAASQTNSKGTAVSDTTVTRNCTMWNTATTCNITSPVITASAATPSVYGYSTAAGTHSSSWNSNTTKAVSSNGTYYAQTYKSGKTITITFNKNGAASQTNSKGTAVSDATVTRSCNIATTYNGSAQATSCNITSPVITASSATPSVYGYSTAAGTHSSSWNSNTTKAVSSNGTYYAQTYKSAVTYTAKWGSNGATLSSTANKTCTIGATYNGTSQTTSCTVTAPTITRSGFTIAGFNTNSGGTTSSLSSGGTLTLTSSNNNSTWYAISYKSVVIKWDANNATISKTQDSCTIWNTATSCNITSPTISRTNYFIIGWNTSSSSTTSAWNTSTQKAVSSDATYYAITELATAVNVTGSTRTLYRSLDAAMKASTSSSTTTTLLKNTTENITISTAVTANVNLNSKTMTGLLDNNYASSNITLSGGTITNSNNRSINNKGKITINSGTYTSSSTAVGEAIQNVSGATLNINGGYISSTASTTNAISNAGTINISNGTVEAKNSNSGETGQYSTVYNEGTMKLSGGTIIQNGNSHSVRTKGNFSMSGGKIKLTLVGTGGTALINISGGIVNTTGGTIESTGYGFVNRAATGTSASTLCTISNMTINITSTSGHQSILNDLNSYTLLKNNTIYSATTSDVLFYNTSGTLVSYNDTLKSSQAILGVLYKYTVFGSGDVEVEVFGRSDITSFPTWSDANGQDDIKWYGATDYKNSLGTYKFARIYASNHNNEKGTLYHTHIYAGSTFVYGFDYTMPA